MDVVLIRHARPEVAAGICYGRLDLPLAQPFSAGPMAAGLRNTVRGTDAARMLCSPQARARDTALALAHALALPEPAIEPDLRELDFGDWEGQPWDDIPRAQLDAWAADLLGARPHGGESAAQAQARVTAWADALPVNDPGSLLVVGHAGPMRMLAAHWLAAPLARTLGWELAYGATCGFRLGAGAPCLLWWNRVAG